MTNTAIYVILVFLSFGGFLLAFFINHKKQSKETMVCPLKANCDIVIHSSYSEFLGIPIEKLGMLYYAAIALSYGTFVIFPQTIQPFFVFVLYSLTIFAFLFSVYLTALQAFAIKNWCTWCLISASLCTIIFLVSLTSTAFQFPDLLHQYRDMIILVHIMAMSVGVGSATVSDILFFRFLNDFKISETENDILNSISHVIWLALAVIVVTGIGLYIPEMERLNESPKFLAKMIVIGIIIANGTLLNLIISPLLLKIPFGGSQSQDSPELSNIRKLAFVFGSISIVSWYSAFMLGSLRSLDLNLGTILLAYITVLSIAVASGQVLERKISRRL